LKTIALFEEKSTETKNRLAELMIASFHRLSEGVTYIKSKSKAKDKRTQHKAKEQSIKAKHRAEEQGINSKYEMMLAKKCVSLEYCTYTYIIIAI
jgi:hypothetical protein